MFEIFGGDLPVLHQTVSRLRKTDRRLTAQTNLRVLHIIGLFVRVIEDAKAYAAETKQTTALFFGADFESVNNPAGEVCLLGGCSRTVESGEEIGSSFPQAAIRRTCISVIGDALSYASS